MSDLDDLFDQASKLTGDELDQFLSELTEVQQRELEKRFAATTDPHVVNPDPHATTERATDRNRPKGFVPNPQREPRTGVPAFIGPYKILQSIGQGGMGQVFMAEQREPIRRRVAIKVINTDAPTDTVLARFEVERQSLAMMDHRNIAKVLDASRTEDGRPYFAMELVKGVPITEFCDSNRLTLDERLRVFVQVCRAIQHAHQKGVIHRDLKPSNVLVASSDGEPVAKVIDFGLAKAMHDQMQLTQRTLFTRHGQILGTLEYMSPEQAELNRLDIDARTDVYSLGVMLYELVTGSTPIGRDRIRSEAFDRILALIREEHTPAPSKRLLESREATSTTAERQRTDLPTLCKRLKSGLDWIVLRSLEKDRARRYESAGLLGDDLERFLRDEVSLARPPSVPQRIMLACREYVSRQLLLTAIPLILICVTVFLAWPSSDSLPSDLSAESDKTVSVPIDAETLDAKGAPLVDKTLDFQGRWKVVREYLPMRGFFPKQAIEQRKNTWIFHGNTLTTLRRPTQKTRAGHVGTVSLRSSETERHFDFSGRDSEGHRQWWRGIFEANGERLTLCFRPQGLNTEPARPTTLSLSDQPDVVYLELIRQ